VHVERGDGRALLTVGEPPFLVGLSASVEATAARAAGTPSDGPVKAPPSVRAPLPFRRDPSCGDGAVGTRGACGLVAEAKLLGGAATIVATIAESEDVDGVRLAIEPRLGEALWMSALTVELEAPAAAIELVGRDLRLRTVGAGAKPVYLERFDPKWIRLRRGPTHDAHDLVIAVGDGVDAVMIAPPSKPGGNARVRLALVDANARPFVHDARCVKRWRDPNRRLSHPFRLFQPGELTTARAMLESADEGPVVLARWPDGRRAAFSITDHADQSDVNTFVALTDALVAEGLRITKALFASGAAPRRQLDDARVLAAAEKLRAAGSEIIPHSLTPQPEPRSMLERGGLGVFARFEPKTWIDHQPATNCEAFGAAGWRSDGRWGIADLLARFGVRYLWLEIDAPRALFNLLDPRHLEARAPTVWPLGRLDAGGPPSLWMFRSIWAFFANRSFYSFYSPTRLDALEHDRGLHVAHTYLETYHRPGTLFGRRNLFVPADPKRDKPGGSGPVALAPKFRALLADLGARQRRGTMWIAPIAEIADRLRATGEVTIVRARGGALRVTAPTAIPGATFVVVGREVQARLDGVPLAHRRLEEGSTVMWADLTAGEHTLEIVDPVKSARQ
jgi:hypothetical protein